MRATWAVVCGLVCAVEAAAVPVTLTHQGRLLDATGAPINGSRDLTITLWSHATSTDVPTHRSYTENFAATPLQDGTYSLLLGAGGGLDASALAGDRWVEVTVNSVALTPRTKVSSVPSAANAVGSNLAALDGAIGLCPNGSFRTFSGTTGTWSTCPTSWTCTTEPTHPGCVSSSTYATCKAIDDDPAFVGTSGSYYIDPDGGSGGVASFQTWCDMVEAGGGWTRIGVFDGTSHTSISHAQAQAIPFQDARLSKNGSGTLLQINCYASATPNGFQTGATDRQCTASPWYIRVASHTGDADYGFYRGALTTNHGGCSWGWGTYVWGRHNGISPCAAMGQGEDYQVSTAWNGNTFWMYVR